MENWKKQSTLPDRTGEVCDSKPSTSNSLFGSSPIAVEESWIIPKQRSKLFHSLKYLTKISHTSPNEIILQLIEKLDDFVQFLESNLEPDSIVVTITILSKMCSSSFRQNKFAILKAAAEASFLQKLDNYVRTLKREDAPNLYFWKTTEEFFINLLFVCDFFTEMISIKANESLPELLESIDVVVTYLEKVHNFPVSEKVKLNIQALIKKLNFSEKENGADASGNFPINNYRKSNAYPTSEEILTPICMTPSEYFVEGRYDNIEHYLDVQFRLLKEHFIASLRYYFLRYYEDITKYIESVKNIASPTTLSTVAMYPNVVFQSIAFIPYYGVGVIFKFSNQENMDEIFSQRSKYFISRTIVIFSKDNFSSVLLGRVIKLDCEQRRIIIDFEPEYNNFDLNASYTMIGSKTFYEPHYYGLKAVQCMSEVDFPMKKYLVDAEPSVEAPAYLDSSCSVYTIQGRKVNLFGNNWPSANQLKLDFSQYSAFKAALTQKFVVIQGFPGTGKTYLGLQIVKTLLQESNRKIWYSGTPILIVSSSNQALDTFLEGLIGITSKIIRFGENIKNEKLMKFSLKTVRREHTDAYVNCVITWRRKREKLSEQIEECIRHLSQIKKCNVIVNFTKFATIDENIKTSWFIRASNADLRAWLFDEQENDNVNPDSIEIEEILNDKIEKEKTIVSEDDRTSFEEQRTISTCPDQTILLSKSHMWFQIVQITKQLQNIKTLNQMHIVKKLKKKLTNLWQTYQYFQVKMDNRALSEPPSKPINVDYDSPHGLDSNDRWNLYFYWLNLYKGFLEKKFVELQYEYRELSENHGEVGTILDTDLMKRALVLGMTVHAAPRLQAALKDLRCRIMVVEQASEVSESELVHSLTKHCEHLILFGNPYQLRATIADDNTNKPTNPGISIMERMVKNKIQYHDLRDQHRMSIEISRLLVPHVYSEFDNYHSVTKCPAIVGIPSGIFFVHHESRDIDGYSSRANLYEAKFLINLACYMLRLGCKPADITILSAFSEQTHVLCEESKKYERLLRDVRICSLESYQSQECKIILLSLVRNIHDGKVGYLKNETGVTFALSRAKECLYMMGNIDFLCESSEVWLKIKEVLMEENCLANNFPISCQTNPAEIIMIREPEDFQKISKQSCSKICGSALGCGHRCLKSCQIVNCDYTQWRSQGGG